jgi:hypothetical protein
MSRTIALVVSALGLLSACGLGGGSYTPPPPPDLITVSPVVLRFEAELGSESPPQQITVTNRSKVPVAVYPRLEVPGKGASTYNMETTCAPVLDAGSACTFTLAFKPVGGAINHALLLLRFNSKFYMVRLNGVVTTADDGAKH